MDLILFSKQFHDQSVRELCETAIDLGFDGIDLTVRPGGHVDPEAGHLEKDLKDAVDIIRTSGLSVPLITTSVVHADDPYSTLVFRTAGELGIPFVKLGYDRYEEFGTFHDVVSKTNMALDGIERLAKRSKVCAVVHNHSGGVYVNAMPAVVTQMIENRDPEAVAAYVDIGHLVGEGVRGSWKQGLDLLAPFIKVVSAKSFGFFPVKNEGDNRVRWVSRLVPFDEGTVPWDEFLGILVSLGFDGPVSFHSEYRGSRETLLNYTRRDLSVFRKARDDARHRT